MQRCGSNDLGDLILPAARQGLLSGLVVFEAPIQRLGQVPDASPAHGYVTATSIFTAQKKLSISRESLNSLVMNKSRTTTRPQFM